MNVNAATALSARAGRTLSKCTFDVPVGDLSYDPPLPILDVYNQGTGDHFTPDCAKTGGTYDQVTFSARFYMQRLEE